MQNERGRRMQYENGIRMQNKRGRRTREEEECNMGRKKKAV